MIAFPGPLPCSAHAATLRSSFDLILTVCVKVGNEDGMDAIAIPYTVQQTPKRK